VEGRVPQAAWVVLGTISLGAGALGLLLPIVPTVPFLLLTAWCWSKGSRRLHDWLLGDPRLGPPLHAWQRHGAISLRAKLLATVVIAGSSVYPVGLSDLPGPVRLAAGLLSAAVIAFLLTRPAPPEALVEEPAEG
jgi:hypothetical protein